MCNMSCGQAHYEAVKALTDEQLDQMFTLLTALTFGQGNTSALDTKDSLFNRVAGDLAVDMRRHWKPDEAFLSRRSKGQLEQIAHESGAAAYRTGPLMKRLDLETPRRVCAAMLARQFIKPPFQRFSQTEIITRYGQNFTASFTDGIKKPVGQRNLQCLHTAITGFFHCSGMIDEAEDIHLLAPAGRDVRFDLCALQAAQRILKQLITSFACRSIGYLQQFVRSESQNARNLPSFLQCRHALRYTENQNIPVMYGC